MKGLLDDHINQRKANIARGFATTGGDDFEKGGVGSGPHQGYYHHKMGDPIRIKQKDGTIVRGTYHSAQQNWNGEFHTVIDTHGEKITVKRDNLLPNDD